MCLRHTYEDGEGTAAVHCHPHIADNFPTTHTLNIASMIIIETAYAWLKLKMKIAKRKRKSKADAKVKSAHRSQSDDMSESTKNSQDNETSASTADVLSKKELNSRSVNFSLSQTRVVHFDGEQDLVWHKSADLRQFKEDAMKTATKTQNGEKICW